MAGTNELTIQIKAVLDEYNAEVRAVVAKEAQVVAKETATRLRETSSKKSGEYAKGWTVKKNGEGDYTVHNKNKPGLTHLLEHGHAKVNGGRVKAIPHIKPAEEWAATEFVRRVEAEL